MVIVYPLYVLASLLVTVCGAALASRNQRVS
ncbi:hypothetical protein RSUY_10830 [Ralstonia solanacearum]|nr:hypothetical protein RSUY_10830 [Ralstonia solanacearum]